MGRMYTLRYMVDDGSSALIEHDDGRLFSYEFYRFKPGLTHTYRVVDDDFGAMADAARYGWARFNQEFADLSELDAFRQKWCAAKFGQR